MFQKHKKKQETFQRMENLGKRALQRFVIQQKYFQDNLVYGYCYLKSFTTVRNDLHKV